MKYGVLISEYRCQFMEVDASNEEEAERMAYAYYESLGKRLSDECWDDYEIDVQKSKLEK